MSQSNNTTPADVLLVPAVDPTATVGLWFTVAELRAAMSPIGYMTPGDQINAAAALAAQTTANAAIPESMLGQPLGPVQSDATNKVPLANLPSSVIGSSHFLGVWNAATNTPVIASGTAPPGVAPVGGYYVVSVSGTPTIDGVSVWNAGDWIIWNGTIWSRLQGQINPVSSVAGLQGAITTPQLATALNGGVALSSLTGQLNVILGTSSNSVAAGNDSRIVGAIQSSAYNTANGPLQLDGNANLGGLTLAANIDVCQTHAELVAYQPPSPQVLVNGQRIHRAYYANQTDQGALDFVWNSGSNVQADVALTVCPSWNQTNVPSYALFTADGSTVAFSGKLPNTHLIPGSLSIILNGAVIATDNGAGQFTGGNVETFAIVTTHGKITQYISTINYITGAWAITFLTAPAAGATTISYNYPTGGGRWLGQLTSFVDVRKFGMPASAGADIQPYLAAADLYAYNNNTAIHLPSPPSGGSWTLVTPFVQNCHEAFGDAAFQSGQGTNINFLPVSPVDLLTAWTLNNSRAICRRICITGPDSNSQSPNGLLTNGWIITAASFTGTISGTALTVNAVLSGTIAIGQSIACAGMTSVASITAGGGTSWTISNSQTITSAQTFTATTLPNYSAFKQGCAAFSMNAAQVSFYDCTTGSIKVGLLLNAGNGHVYTENNNFQGLIGVYVYKNGGDFWFERDEYTTCGFASVLFGNGGSGFNGGADKTAFVRCHFGYGPYGIYQCNDGGTGIQSYQWGPVQFIRSTIEQIGEAAIYALPATSNIVIDWDCLPFGTFTTGVYALPAGLSPSPRRYWFDLEGQLAFFKCRQGVNFPVGSIATAYVGSVTGKSVDMELRALLGSVVFGGTYPSSLNIDVRSPYHNTDFIGHAEFGKIKDISPAGNLLKNPEVSANWTAQSGSSISVVTLASLIQTGGALAGVTVPAQMWKECGNTPNVVVFTNTSAYAAGTLAPVLAALNVYRTLNFHAWALTASSVNFALSTSAGILYAATLTPNGAFIPLAFTGNMVSDVGGAATMTNMGFNGVNTGATLYLVCPMLSYDDFAPYTPLNLPTAINGLAIGGQSSGISPSSWPQIVAFNGTPPAGTFPNATLGINTAATSAANALYTYLSTGWTAI